MKLQNRSLAGLTLAVTGGQITVDAEGVVDVEDKGICDQLVVVGFKPLFSKSPESVVPLKAAPKVAAPEIDMAPSVEAPAGDSPKSKKGKG